MVGLNAKYNRPDSKSKHYSRSLITDQQDGIINISPLLNLEMYTLIAIGCFVGFFQYYNTSLKAKLSSDGAYEKWIQSNRGNARISGAVLLIAGFVVLVIKDGLGIGAFTFLLLLMTAACYTIALAPLNCLKLKHILLIISVSFLLELFLFK